MRGRKPTPTALKRLAGNPGKRPLNKNEVCPRPGLPECPSFLDKVGKAEWERISAELSATGLLTHFDMAALAAYCACWSRFAKLEKAVQKEGEVVDDAVGTKRNPKLLALNRTVQELRALGSDFGLNPVARSRLASAPNSQERDDFSDFLKSSMN